MRRSLMVVALAVAAVSPWSGVAATEGPGRAAFATPEDAVRAYLQGVADADPEAILHASAVADMADGYRFDLAVDRLQSWFTGLPFPAEHELFAAADQHMFESDLLRQVGFLAYSLLTDVTIDGTTIAPVDQAWGERVERDLDAGRLGGLVVADIRPPDLGGMDRTRALAGAAGRAATWGADEEVERVALVSFENDLYAVGFVLLRYGDRWGVESQHSRTARMSTAGVPTPVTPDEYDAMTED